MSTNQKDGSSLENSLPQFYRDQHLGVIKSNQAFGANTFEKLMTKIFLMFSTHSEKFEVCFNTSCF